MSDRVANRPLDSLKVRENKLCYLNHSFQALFHCTLLSQRLFIAADTGY